MKNRHIAFHLGLLLFLLLVGGWGAAAVLTPLVHANTITVTTTDDEVNNDGDCSLREAILAANGDTAVDNCPAGSGADVIILPSGTYTLSLVGAGEDAAQTGDLNLTADVTINGGGLYASGIVTLINATLISNTAFGDGGGLLAFGQANVYGSRFIDNVCADQGGGMYVGSFLTVKQSAFVGNRGGRGGAIFHGALNGLLENSLLAENTATNAGDHLFLNSSYPVTLNYVTAVGTAGGMGTGIHITNTPLLITNTIVASHTVGLNNLNGSITQDYNLFFGNGTDIQGSASGGSHNVSGDPRFISFMTDSYHLGQGSAAIDVGVDTGLVVDYDGHLRPLGNGFDIGFDEANPPPIYLPLVTR